MVPCLHQGNIYIQRKLRVWREQKCISLVGAETPLTCAGRQTTPSHGERYRAENGDLRKLGWTYRHGTMFAPRKVYIKRKLQVWRAQKCIPLVGAEIPPTCVGRQTTPSHGRWYRAENGNLCKLGWTYCHGTVSAPRQSFYPKEATVMERTEMYSTSLCRNPIYLCGPSNYPVSWGRYRADNRNLCQLGWTYRHGIVFAPRQCLYQKTATSMEKPEMYSTSRCRNLTYLCWLANYPVSWGEV